MQKRIDLYTQAEPPFDNSTASELEKRAYRRELAQALMRVAADTTRSTRTATASRSSLPARSPASWGA